MFPLVSVIIPAYNAGNLILDTIDSVTAQTYRHIEILVVDDGSTDETVELVVSRIKQDSRIRLLQQRNLGVGAARNAAIQVASGEFIAPLDADDVWFPEKLESQVKCFLESNERTGLIYTWSLKIDESRRPLGQSCGDFEGDVFVDLLGRNFIGNASSPLIRRTCLIAVGGYNEHFKAREAQGCEDWDLYLKLSEHFEFRCVRRFLTGYRQVGNSMSDNYPAMERSYWEMIKALRERQPDIPDQMLDWSTSNFYYYLAGKCSAAGNFPQALVWLQQCVQLDWPRLFCFHWYKAWTVCVLGSIAQSLAWKIVRGQRPLRIQPMGRRMSQVADSYSSSSVKSVQSFYDRLQAGRFEDFRRRWILRNTEHSAGPLYQDPACDSSRLAKLRQ